MTFIAGMSVNSFAQNSLHFDGTDDFVQTNNPGVLGSNDRTFEAWINISVNAPTSNLTILDYGINAAGDRNTFVVDGNRGLRFISGGSNANLSYTTGVLTVGQWVHVAFVLDSGTGYLYVDGVQVATGSLSNVNTSAGNTNIRIGQRVAGGSIPFQGNIDEVRVWNVARTAAEIQADRFNELCSTPSTLVAYYKFNQGTAQGNNAGLTNVLGELGDTAVATNFAMNGLTSNWDTGAVVTPAIPIDYTVTLDTANSILTANDTNSNNMYQWIDCSTNTILARDTNRSFAPRSAGSYAVIISNSACSDTSICYTINGAVNPNIHGEALNFDGTNDYVQTSYPGILDTNNRTFEAWINVSPSAPSSNLTILDYGLNSAGSRNTFVVDGSRGIRFTSGGTNANLNSPAGVIQPGQWEHVAFVLNSGVGYLYVNGTQVATGNLSSVNTPANNTDVRFGERISGGSIPFSGFLDEVRIWNVARTAAEINASMNEEFCDAIPGLGAYFKMNQGVARGNNSSLASLENFVKTGDGTFMNFALSGATSNFDTTGANISLPIIDTTVTQTGIVLTANDTTVQHYQWYDCTNNTVLVSDTLQSFTAQSNGNYSVILTKNGCSDTSACVTVLSVGLTESDFQSYFSISNNPIVDNFKLLNNNSLKVRVSIRNLNGALVAESKITSESIIEFDGSQFPKGVYFLTIQTEEGASTNFKLLKL